MMNTGVPIYLITGFLESGKTNFLKFTMRQDYFADNEKTLLIVCEEGIEEYDPSELADQNTVMVICESEDDFTADYLRDLKRQYRPERVVIEYDGMWRMSTIMDMKLPFAWELYQIIMVVDTGSFGLYLNNMKSLVVDMVSRAEMVMFNRATPDMPCANYKRAIKAVNRRIQTVFEDENGDMLDIPEELPYDISGPVIDVEDDDFGIWYIDAMDHPENYEGKTMHFKAMAMTSSQFPKGSFVPGRMAMTCCANDISFLGFICMGNDLMKVKNKQWIDVTAKFKYQYMNVYEGEGPVLSAESIKPAEPASEELVYFN